MKKSEFLRELKYNLMGKVSDDELESIIMDYDEIFESGKAEGKAEEEISEMLGSPAMIAKAILDENSDNASKLNDENYPVASLGKRIIAFMIDYMLSLMPLIILLCFIEAPRFMLFSVFPMMIFNPIVPLFVIFFLLPQFSGIYSYSAPGVERVYTYPVHGINTHYIVFIVIGFIFFWLYGTLAMVVMKGRTVGMRLMGIKVIKKDRSTLRPLDIIIRQFIGKILLAGITSNISYIVSLFWAVFSKTNNTIHDKLAGTIVIEDR